MCVGTGTLPFHMEVDNSLFAEGTSSVFQEARPRPRPWVFQGMSGTSRYLTAGMRKLAEVSVETSVLGCERA